MWHFDEEKCMICGTIPCNDNPETAITFEHIIPEALGNHNFGGCFLCKKCNGRLGELVDTKLCNNDIIALIRLRFNLAGKSGRFPAIQGRVDNIENVKVINRNLRFPNYLKEVEKGKFVISATTKNEAISMITKTLQRRGCSNATIEKALSYIKKLTPRQIKNPTLKADAAFDKKEFTLPFIKIAYEYALVKLGAEYQKDCFGNLLKELLYSFVKGEGDTPLLNALPVFNIFGVIDDSLRQNNVSENLYDHYSVQKE